MDSDFTSHMRARRILYAVTLVFPHDRINFLSGRPRREWEQELKDAISQKGEHAEEHRLEHEQAMAREGRLNQHKMWMQAVGPYSDFEADRRAYYEAMKERREGCSERCAKGHTDIFGYTCKYAGLDSREVCFNALNHAKT